MALNTSKCNHLTPLPFKGLKSSMLHKVTGTCKQISPLFYYSCLSFDNLGPLCPSTASGQSSHSFTP